MPQPNNLYAPPSPDELKAAQQAQAHLFAPPSEEEIAAAKGAQKDEPGTTSRIGSLLFNLAVSVGKKFDSYTGAPMRAGISAAQNADQPSQIVSQFGKGFAEQYGNNPDTAPTGEDIVKRGFNLEGTPAKVAGFGMDLAANPVNFIAPGLSALGKAVNASREIPYVGDAVGAVANFPGKVANWATNKVTHAPEKALEVYSRDPKVVNSFIQDTGGEFSAGADKMKKEIVDTVQAKKQFQGEQISKALDAAGPDPVTSSQPLLEPLVKAQSQINKHTDPAAWKHIQNQIDTIQNVAPDGTLNLRELFDVKNYLQDQRYGTLRQPNGDLFLVADDAKRAAGQSLSKATDILHSQSPAIKEADQFYSQLHDIDNTLSTGLLGQGKAEDIFASAGGATPKYGNQHYTALKKIDDLVGTHGVQDAETVFSARSLNKNPSIAKEAFKTVKTFQQGISDAGVAPRGYNVIQILGAPKTAIDRRIASERKE